MLARSGFFATLAPWIDRFEEAWPSVDAIDRALSADAGVRFERATPKRGRGAAARPSVPYDARIVEAGIVPTRERSLHDLMNALVWAAFPRAKRALHARQRDLIAASPDKSRRSVEHDTIAMLDEGGVLLIGEAPARDGDIVDPRACFVFGHALYQHLTEGRTQVFGLGVPLDAGETPALADVDRRLAGLLEDRRSFQDHRDLVRVRIA